MFEPSGAILGLSTRAASLIVTCKAMLVSGSCSNRSTTSGKGLKDETTQGTHLLAVELCCSGCQIGSSIQLDPSTAKEPILL